MKVAIILCFISLFYLVGWPMAFLFVDNSSDLVLFFKDYWHVYIFALMTYMSTTFYLCLKKSK